MDNMHHNSHQDMQDNTNINMQHMKHDTQNDMQHMQHDGHQHHGNKDMVKDFRIRFIYSTIATIPVLLLSPLIQSALNIEDMFQFPGYTYVIFIISSFSL